MLILNLAPEIETHLRLLARQNGVEPTTYAERLLTSVLPQQSLAQTIVNDTQRAITLTPEERLAAFREWVSAPRREFLSLTDEALSRDNIYGARG